MDIESLIKELEPIRKEYLVIRSKFRITPYPIKGMYRMEMEKFMNINLQKYGSTGVFYIVTGKKPR